MLQESQNRVWFKLLWPHLGLSMLARAVTTSCLKQRSWFLPQTACVPCHSWTVPRHSTGENHFCFGLALLFSIYGFILTIPLGCSFHLAEVTDLRFEVDVFLLP